MDMLVDLVVVGVENSFGIVGVILVYYFEDGF